MFGTSTKTEAGAGIKPFDASSENQRSVVSDFKPRYVFAPLTDIPLINRNITGAMSTNRIIRGRLNYIQQCPYKIRDESDAAMMAEIGERDIVPLREEVNTPFAQALYLYEAYSEKGLVVIDSLTGLDPDIAVALEESMIPELPNSLKGLIRYLQTEAQENLRQAALSDSIKALGFKTLTELLRGSEAAWIYANKYLDDIEGELIAARNNKPGKSTLDSFDYTLYEQTERPTPKEKDLEFKAVQDLAKNSGNDRLAESLDRLASLVVAPQVATSPDSVSLPRQEFEEMQRQMNELRKQFEDAQTTTTNTPVVTPNQNNRNNRGR